jgi:sn-glycerol 3-phosphate transport system permease protein
MMDKPVVIISQILNHVIKIAVIFIFVFPFFWMFSVSLQTTEETVKLPVTIIPKSLQLINFVHAWQAGPFPMYIRNSIYVIASIILLQMVIMVPAAYAFAKYEFKGKALAFALVIIAFMTPTQITFVPVYQMMASMRLLATLLPQILPFMTNAFGIFLLRQYFMQVPNEIIEAAKLDKAGEFKIVFRIMLPMSKAALSTIVLFSFVSHWNEYFWALIMTNTIYVRTLPIGVAMLRASEGVIDWNIIMAGNMILAFPILLVYVFASRNIIKAFAYSGIK